MGSRRAVIDVKQSPGNRHEWILTLECGHQKWIVTNGRPTKKSVRCMKCRSDFRVAKGGDRQHG
jgi:hypothetical protein